MCCSYISLRYIVTHLVPWINLTRDFTLADQSWWSPATALFLGLIMPQYSPLAVPICHTPSCQAEGQEDVRCPVTGVFWSLVCGSSLARASWYFLSQGGVAQPAGRQQLKWPFLQFTTIKPFLCGLFWYHCLPRDSLAVSTQDESEALGTWGDAGRRLRIL